MQLNWSSKTSSSMPNVNFWNCIHHTWSSPTCCDPVVFICANSTWKHFPVCASILQMTWLTWHLDTLILPLSNPCMCPLTACNGLVTLPHLAWFQPLRHLVPADSLWIAHWIVKYMPQVVHPQGQTCLSYTLWSLTAPQSPICFRAYVGHLYSYNLQMLTSYSAAPLDQADFECMASLAWILTKHCVDLYKISMRMTMRKS